MIDSKTGTRNIQDELGVSGHNRKQKILLKIVGPKGHRCKYRVSISGSPSGQMWTIWASKGVIAKWLFLHFHALVYISAIYGIICFWIYLFICRK